MSIGPFGVTKSGARQWVLTGLSYDPDPDFTVQIRSETVPEQQSLKDMNFETALADLEKIVGQLESGDVALEQSIALYERGDALRKHCDTKLKEARLKVDKIVLGKDGALQTEPADLG
ncbi:MAG: exodeoxyribonuclease VII small subunit [Robiginitomaculum sp.]|nr:MAG: exodeoxyribonuclease VII small subunit [Robiginitomaculum sp.]